MTYSTLIFNDINQHRTCSIGIEEPPQYFSEMDEPNQEYEPMLEPKNPSKQNTFYIL